MNEETFKITCRAYFPDCTFRHGDGLLESLGFASGWPTTYAFLDGKPIAKFVDMEQFGSEVLMFHPNGNVSLASFYGMSLVNGLKAYRAEMEAVKNG